MNRILIIAHQFPPAGGIGVQRVLKFCRDLPDYGWEPLVLTSGGDTYPNQDPSLLTQIGFDMEIVRVDLPFFIKGFLPKLEPVSLHTHQKISKKIGHHFWIYDDFYPWIPAAYLKGIQVLNRFKPHVIFSTGSPFCSMIAAYLLSLKGKIPFLVDFRDGWHDCEYRRDRGELPRWLEKISENLVLKNCQKAFFVTQGLLKQYVHKCPEHAHKFKWLPNGFDRTSQPPQTPFPVAKNGRLQIKYVGKFTHYRRPDAFLRGLKRAVEHLNCSTIDVEFVGGSDGRLHRHIQELNLSEYVKVTDFISHSKALESMAQADVLLLAVDRTPGYQVIQTGKLFEYMLTQRPILCISPMDSEAAITIRQNNLGKTLEPEDESGIAHALATWAGEKKEHGALAAAPYELPKTYNHQRIVSELVHRLHDATNGLLYERTAA